MEVITMESQVFKDLTVKINSIAKFVLAHQEKENEKPIDDWVDSYEVCTFLKINSRTLQRYRTLPLPHIFLPILLLSARHNGE
jgi:hypothetical protein